jgi:hypothetical protein
MFILAWILRESIREHAEYFFGKIFGIINNYLRQLNTSVTQQQPPHIVNSVAQESLAKKYEAYEAKMKQKFMLSYDLTSDIDYNTNVDDIFYDPEKHHYAVLAENNQYEKTWKTRILIESIPDGSVIMYYDPYKRGFAYFSVQSIPYHLLNAIAMKYVLTYRCRYFFMDEAETPASCPSKLIDLEKWELKEKRISNSEGIKFLTSTTKDVWTQSREKGPFAKFKSYNTPVKKAVEQRKGKQTVIKNRFIYLGNPRYFSILQKIPFPLHAKKKMSYKEFKALKSKMETDNLTKTDTSEEKELESMCMKLKPNAPL